MPDFHVGDTVEVDVRIREGDKERVQTFAGVVIARKGGVGPRASFTVRRIVQGEGVERVFPLHSPHIAAVRVKRAGRVRRAKLYYLRERFGKAARIKERRLHPAGGKSNTTAARRTSTRPSAAAEDEAPSAAEG